MFVVRMWLAKPDWGLIYSRIRSVCGEDKARTLGHAVRGPASRPCGLFGSEVARVCHTHSSDRDNGPAGATA